MPKSQRQLDAERDGTASSSIPSPPPLGSGGRDYSKVYAALGIEIRTDRSDEALTRECPWCGRNRCYVNIRTGLHHCKHCDEKGNITQFLTWMHKKALEETSPADYQRLKAIRGIPLQVFKRHELAWSGNLECWLVPFKGGKSSVVNLMRYYPDRNKPNKLMLPELPTAIYGFDRLVAANKGKPVLLCEGPFDAIALDHSIGSQNRPKYVIIATPGAFKDEWAEHFRSRKVRCFYDNDKGGWDHTARVQKLLGEGGVAEELLALRWPNETPDGYDVDDLVRDHGNKSVLGWLVGRCYKVARQPKLAWEFGWARNSTGPEVIDWVWPNRLRCGTYASFSGRRGTMKSTIVREIIARFTQGLVLPGCDEVGLPAGPVIYVTAEDSLGTVWAGLELAGADTNLIMVLPAVLKDGDPMNVLEHLDELRQKIREHEVRLVVIDGQNSVVGAPNISNDMLARHNVTNKLHQFAQRENICLVGIRNEDTEGRAYGPASMSDLGRCILRVQELEPLAGERYFMLIFERISDAAPSTCPPMPYSVEDLGGSARRILWEKERPHPAAADTKILMARLAAKVVGKGS